MLPPLYASWIGAVLPGPVPEERHATCSSCAMCKRPGDAATASLESFDPDVKCCSYTPTLWNFLVGRVLTDDSPDMAVGRASVERRLDAGAGVTPLGLETPLAYRLVYEHRPPGFFGRNKALRCPHYVEDGGGRCGIWRHRESVCTTYFCKYERGSVGRSFWEALKQFLRVLERRLALWCAVELNVDADALATFLVQYVAPDLPYAPGRHGAAGSGAKPTSRELWGDRWAERKRDFYAEAATLVGSLSWERVERIAGPAIHLRVKTLREAYAGLASEEVPDYLRLVAVRVMPRGGDSSAVVGYSSIDLPILPARLVDELVRFDGCRSTAAVLRELAAAGVPIDLPAVRRLIDFGVLVEGPKTIGGPPLYDLHRRQPLAEQVYAGDTAAAEGQ